MLCNIWKTRIMKLINNEAKEESIIPNQLIKIFYIWRFYGIAPATLITIKTSSNHYYVCPSRLYAIMSFLFLSSLISVYMVCITYNTIFIDSNKEIRKRTGISYLIHVIHVSLFCGIMYAYAFKCYKKIIVFGEYMNTIHKLHQEINSNFTNVKIKYANLLVVGLLSSIGIIGCIYMIDIIQDIICNHKDVTVLLRHVIYFIWYQVAVLMQFRFMFIICLVNSIIDVLSERLQQLPFKVMLYSSLGHRTSNREYATLQRLSQTYIFLCQLITKIEKQEGVLILSVFAYKFIDIMDALFLILSSFLARGNITISFLMDNILEITWIIVRGFTIYIFFSPCHQTQVKVETLQVTMSHLICASNKELRKELCKFSGDLINNVPMISPLGMFLFTRHQLVLVCSALFTFMIIIIQLRLKAVNVE